MSRPRAGALAALVLSLLALAGSAGAAVDRGGVRVFVDAGVLRATADGGRGEFVVLLREQVDVDAVAARERRWQGKGRAVVAALRARARATQPPIVSRVRSLGGEASGYWVVNAVRVRGDRRVVEALAGRSDVLALESDRSGSLRPLTDRAAAAASSASAPAQVWWNVAKIGAPAAWAGGARGQDVVVGIADTGVRWDHPALKRQYRGWDGASARHDRNWWDGVRGDLDGDGRNACGFASGVPCDDHGHGTYVGGIAVGDDGAGNQIGVAPAARWIGCRNMDEGVGRPSAYIECLQFFLAPTDLAGRDPQPDLRPHVVVNSYSCDAAEGCAADTLRGAVDAMAAAGVAMAVAAGNTGPSCSTVQWPPAVYESALVVGASDAGDAVWSRSSRGPVFANGSGRREPDVVAPGVDIRSALRNGYGTGSGTSAAAPHVAGAVALLWSAVPSLRRDLPATGRLLRETAVPLTTADGCGGDSPTSVPNNAAGHGRIDVAAALRRARGATPVARAVVATFRPVRPVAGRVFTVATVRVRLSNGALVRPQRHACQATLAGRALRGTGAGRCTWRLPPTARRKTLVVRVTATHGGVSRTLRPRFTVR